MNILLVLLLATFIVSVLVFVILYHNATKKLNRLRKQNLLYENTLIVKSEKEAWLQGIFDSSNVGIFIFTVQDMKMIFCNLMFEKLLLSKFKTIKKDNIAEFWEPEDWPSIRQGIDSIEKGINNNFRTEVRVIQSHFEVSWIDLSISPVLLQNSSNNFMIGVFTDITDRKVAEQKQAETEKIYNLLVENAEDVIGIVDCEGNNLFFNKKGLEFHQVTADELRNRPTSSFYSSETTAEILNAVKEATLTRKTVNKLIELTLHGKDYIVGFLAIPIIEADQPVTKVQTIGRNLTSEMTTLKQLGEANEMLKRVLAIAQDVLYSAVINLASGEMTYDYLSDKIEALTGYPVSHFTSKPMVFATLIYPDDMKEQLTNMKEIIKSGGNYVFTYRIVKADKSIVQIKDVFEVSRIDNLKYRLAGFLTIC